MNPLTVGWVLEKVEPYSVADENNPKVPINEVVFGTRFDAPELSVVHFGQFYDRIKDKYPEHSMQQGIARPAGTDGVNVIVEVPQAPRMWFSSPAGNLLVQLQIDRFIFNWRRRTDADVYPGFDPLFAEFQRLWALFHNFLTEAIEGEPHLDELALTYIDQIADLDTIGTPIFIFREKAWREDFPEPELWATQFRFAFTDENLKLAVNARPSIRMTTQEQFTNFEMAINVIIPPKFSETDAIMGFFNHAHDKTHWAWKKLVRPEWLKAWGFDA